MSDYRKVALKAYSRIALVVDGLEDEGDRVYLGSTNDADILRELKDERDAHLVLGEEILTSEQEVVALRASNKALHQQLADAKAAQAMVVERAAQLAEDGLLSVDGGLAAQELRALADTDGLALVQSLRAERDALRAAVEGLIAVLNRNDKKGPIPDVEMMFCWLAAQEVRSAFRKIAPKGEAK